MATTDNVRVLKEEKAILEAEEAFAREEQSFLQRVEAVLALNFADRAQQLIGRIDALETAGISSPDLGRARTVVAAGLPADATLAGDERSASLASRRSALQARETALKALASALSQLEATKARRQQEFQAVEVFVAGTEAAVKQMLDQRRAIEAAATEQSAPVTPVAKAAPPPPVAAPPPVVAPPAPVVTPRGTRGWLGMLIPGRCAAGRRRRSEAPALGGDLRGELGLHPLDRRAALGRDRLLDGGVRVGVVVPVVPGGLPEVVVDVPLDRGALGLEVLVVGPVPVDVLALAGLAAGDRVPAAGVLSAASAHLGS